ncbi:MAG: BrnA antitoxin family protein [Rickettsiales bacterium]|jgi:uncharacterized protein (DUF4415 family)|nr:BrnA antitoxin family protein [Rickettsiales bacterium]
MTIKIYTREQIAKMKDSTDWGRVKKIKDKDIDFSDIPMAVPEMLKKAVRYSRGRPVKENKKTALNLRIDPEIVVAFKSTGPGWQTRINDALRQVLQLRSLL